MSAIDLAQKFASFDEYWSPKMIGELNGQCVKIAKFKGEFLFSAGIMSFVLERRLVRTVMPIQTQLKKPPQVLP